MYLLRFAYVLEKAGRAVTDVDWCTVFEFVYTGLVVMHFANLVFSNTIDRLRKAFHSICKVFFATLQRLLCKLIKFAFVFFFFVFAFLPSRII
jgi:hypothetical protein